MAFDNIPRPTDWLDFIGPREGRANGLQGAHFWADNDWATGGRFAFLTKLGFGPNQMTNGNLNAETRRGGFVLGTTLHFRSLFSRSRRALSSGGRAVHSSGAVAHIWVRANHNNCTLDVREAV